MKLRTLFLPSVAFGAAAILILPSQESLAFSKISTGQPVSQRDFRVFNNFADVQANNNTNEDPQFPGYDGAELALWKANVEWGSVAHGNGSGDPLQSTLGNGGANYDPSWQGNASDIGTVGDQVISAISSCSSGVLAFAEVTGGSWRIRFCENITWHDGPGDNSGGFDMQGVGCHEVGHALGLGHSNSSGATMFPSTSGGGSSNQRSINGDDQAGIQCIYGVASGSKPEITNAIIAGNNLTITGSNFDATGNEVWFTNLDCTVPSDDPRVIVSGVSSSGGGSSITVAIPADAGPGDVLVKIGGSGFATLSNAFPVDISGTAGDCPEFGITSVTPGSIEALIPGTAQTVSINGEAFTPSTTVSIDFVPVDPSSYTFIDSTLITMDMPQVNSLGAHLLQVFDGPDSDTANITVVAPANPVLQCGDGDNPSFGSISAGLDLAVGGPVGKLEFVFYSDSNVPSVHPLVSLDMGNNFTSLFTVIALNVPAAGWTSTNIPLTGAPLFVTVYTQSVQLGCGPPFPSSNLQEFVTVP